jgi:hypothetical protein
MAVYEAVITKSGEPTATIRHLRRCAETSISQIQSRISAGQPVVSIDSDDYPLDHDLVEGHAHQHARFIKVIDGLLALGNVLELRYRPSSGDRHEVITHDMMKNLMRSELHSLDQLHD